MPKILRCKKTGAVMIGTLETIPGVAGIGDVFGVNPDGSFVFDYDSNGTDVDWDSQKTATRPVMVGDGRQSQRVFVDEDGDEYLECDLEIAEFDVESDDDGCPVSDPDCLGNNGDCHDACDSTAGNHPRLADWQYLVGNGDTRRGFADWLASEAEIARND